jgi:Cdc6-like AAA superfamily ATPase
MFLQRFKPSAIDPLYLVNRQVDLDWLVGAISTYLSDPDPRARGPLSFCVLGEKGVGKTILTKAALWKLRGQFSDRAIFVEADCRRFRTAKQVIDVIAKGVVEALDDLRRTGTASRRTASPGAT